MFHLYGRGNTDSGNPNFTTLTIDDTGSGQAWLVAHRNTDNLYFQGQDSGTPAFIDIFSKDGDGTDQVAITLYAKGTPSDVATAAEFVRLERRANDTFGFSVEADGTGTVRQLILETEGNSNQFRMDPDGDIGIAKVPGADIRFDVNGSVRVHGDEGGAASSTTFTNATAANDSTAATLGNTPTGIAAGNAAWMRVYVGTTTGYIPYWTA